MENKKLRILWLSDFDPIGSGYQGLSTILCQGLAGCNFDVKAIGLHYRGQEHTFNFSILPCEGLKEAVVGIYNLRTVWQFDVLVVALDINLHNYILDQIQAFRSAFKYIGIMPVESDPLCMSWAMVLLQMDLPLIISEFGMREAHKANVFSARHLQLGVNGSTWFSPSIEERRKYRHGLFNVTDDETFIALTVADNQERKNLSAAIEAFALFAGQYPNSRYVLVTREMNPVGWALRDLVTEYGIQDKVIIMERGMPKEELRGVYAASDCFLLTSKAEGLGLPLLEAMAMGLPCIATDCTGMRELLSDGRGILIPPMMVHRDAFGNGRRYWIDIQKTADALGAVASGQKPDIEKAKAHVLARRWEDAVLFLYRQILKLTEGNPTVEVEHGQEIQTQDYEPTSIIL